MGQMQRVARVIYAHRFQHCLRNNIDWYQ